jgi:hypothetical protein
MSTVGAAGGVLGNTTDQVISNMEGGQTFGQAVENVDSTQQLVSGGISAATSGLLTGVSAVVSNAAQSSIAQSQKALSAYSSTLSKTLQSEATAETQAVVQSAVDGAQQSIAKGMTKLGAQANKLHFAGSTVDNIAIPATEAAVTINASSTK